MKPLAPNTLIQNRYLIVQLIGKGGMGEVYLAVDQRLGSAIALKRTLFSDDENLGLAFEREARMLARLRHTALTKVSDHFSENDVQYLVMEHISGDDLSKRLETNQKPFPLSWVLFWADQLLDALTYLHSHEPPIIHRDIKPQNLKLTTDNHIILLDFGLAKNAGGETRLSTTGGMVAYTPHYASMEQIRGTGTTARSDIYSLSATLYQLLTDNVPPDALSRADNVLNGMEDPVQPIEQFNPEVSPAVSAVLLKGMSLSAEQRFATAKEMQIALREAYSKLQQGMSANTVAFNVADSVPQVASNGEQAKIETEQFSAPVFEQPIGDKTEVMPANLGVGVVENAPVNFDATIPFTTPFVAEDFNPTPVVQEKPEIFPMENEVSFGDKTQVSPISFSSLEPEKTEVLPTNEYDFDEPKNDEPQAFISDDTSVNPAESYSPDATVPLVRLEEYASEIPNKATANIVSNPSAEVHKSFPPLPINTVNKPLPKAKAASGGGGKMFAIVGGLLLLGLVGIGVAGVGLYVYSPETFGVATPTPTPKPTPEPTPEPTIAPTPAPTLETNLEANTNTGNTSELKNTTVNNTSPSGDKTPKPDFGGDKTPRPQPDKTAAPTPAPTQSNPVKPPPTPKPTVTKPPPTPKPTKPNVKPTVDPGKVLLNIWSKK